MSIFKLLAFFIFLGFSSFSFACNGVWTGGTATTAPTTSWSDPNAWSGCIPGSLASDTATFTNTNSGPVITQDAGAITLQTLTFNLGQDWLIQSPGPTTTTTDTLTFSNANSTINMTQFQTIGSELNLPVFISGNTQINITVTGGPITFDNLTIENNAILSFPNHNPRTQINFSNPIVFNSGKLESTNSNSYNNQGGNAIVLPARFGSTSVGTGNEISNQNSGSINALNGFGSEITGIITVNGGKLTNSNLGNITGSAIGAIIGTDPGLRTDILTVNSGTVTNMNSSNSISGGTLTNPSVGSALLFNKYNITGGTVINESSFVSSTTNIGSLIGALGTGQVINIGSPGGTLLNNDTVLIPTINITSGGTLSGIGLYSGANGGTTAVTNGGTVNPFSGSAPGTMTINGTYSQSAGNLLIDLQSDSSSSLLNVQGTASMGGTLTVDFLPGNTVTGSTPFTIVQATTLNPVPFDNVIINNLPDGLSLKMVQDNFGSPGTIILFFSGHVIPPTPSSTLPTTYAGGFIETVLSDINHINSHITVRMQDLRRRFAGQVAQRVSLGYVASTNERYLAFNPETEEKEEQLRREIVETEKPTPWSFYLGPTGRAYGEIHSRDGDPGAHFWSVGGLAGFDYAFSQVGIGFMADYERIYDHVKENWGRIDVDEIHASIYLTYAPSCIPLAINAIGGGAYEKYHIHRNVGAKVAKGNPNGFGYDALLGFEYALEACNFHFIPLANAQYIYLRAAGYTEKGGGSSDIHVNSQRIKSLRSSLGFRMNYTQENGDLIVIPELYAEWQREYMNRSRGIGVAPIAGIGGTILLPGTGRNIWLGGVDLLFTYKERYGVEVSYETEYNSLYHDHFFYLGANFRF